MKQGDRVLIDTNAIIEAHRINCWKALVGYYSVETVAECISECASGNQRRRDYVPIDMDSLKKSVAQQTVGLQERTELALASGLAGDIDAGERDLLAFALTQPKDVYLICSPDKACMRVANDLGIIDRLVSLESLVEKAGMKKLRFKEHYTEKWHSNYCMKILLGVY